MIATDSRPFWLSQRSSGLGVLLCFGLLATDAFAQSPAIGPLKADLGQPQPDSVRASRYLALGEAFLQFQFDSSLHYFRQSIALSKRGNKSRLLSRGYLKLGYAYLRQGAAARSLPNLREAERLQSSPSPDSTHLEIRVLTAIATRSQGNYPRGLQLCLGILRDYELPHVPYYRQLGMAYTELGVIYDHLHQNDKALVYHRKRLAFSKKGTNRRDLLLAHINLGAFYSNIHRLTEAGQQYQYALTIARRYGYTGDITSILTNLGDLANQRHRFDEAISYHTENVRMAKQAVESEVLGWNLLMLARDYQALHRYPTALAYVNRAMVVYQTSPSADEFQQALTTKGQLLVQTGQYRQALRVVQEAQALKDSLMGLDKQKAIADVQAAYDLERKQSQIALLNKNLLIQKQAGQTMQLQLTLAQQQRLLSLIAALGMALLLVLGYFIYRKQQKVKRLLQQQTDEITRQASQLADLNGMKDKLFSLISHDLRSPVAHLKHNFRGLRTNTDMAPALQEPLGRLENQIDRVLDLLTNLLDWSYSQLKGFQTHLQPIDLADTIAETLSQFADSLRQKNIGLINQIPENVQVQADKHQLHSILRNLLSNAIKFTPSGGFIRLVVRLNDGQVELMVQDTGIGMSEEQLSRLATNPHVRAGTQDEPGTGLGLQLCRDLLARQGSTLVVTSQIDKGTKVRIRMPAAATVPEVAIVPVSLG
ncbi:MAG: tetratricopeptide repeat-containing sensor histidine kinase [Rudanella sp.]|nr:tetratricopeptide repeat-containing sensor histidine kinase [Rudanella sp.]